LKIDDSSAADKLDERRFIGCGEKSKKEEDSSAAEEVEKKKMIQGRKKVAPVFQR
jgi:hypothetical protein